MARIEKETMTRGMSYYDAGHGGLVGNNCNNANNKMLAALDVLLRDILQESATQLWAFPNGILMVDPPLAGEVNMHRDKKLFMFLENMHRACRVGAVSSSEFSQETAARSSQQALHVPTEFYRQLTWSKLVLIRIYQWKTPTITLGRNQRASAELFTTAAQEQMPIIQRITGGRAVLHAKEITYSVIAPADHSILGGGIKESYTRIAKILVQFIQSLPIRGQVQTHFVASKPLRKQSALCYDSMGWAEIAIDNHKLIGAAQKRGKHTFLEHGSIPVDAINPSLEHWLKPIVRPRHNVPIMPLRAYLRSALSLTELSHGLARYFLLHLQSSPT